MGRETIHVFCQKLQKQRSLTTTICLGLNQKPESQAYCALLLVLANEIISVIHCVNCNVLVSSYHCYYDNNIYACHSKPLEPFTTFRMLRGFTRIGHWVAAEKVRTLDRSNSALRSVGGPEGFRASIKDEDDHTPRTAGG